MADKDIRWIQRLDNYSRAFAKLNEGVELARQRFLSDLEKQGLIQPFEFTHELAWNVMKDYFAFQGDPSITGSRDAFREAFNKGLTGDGEGWMEMIPCRNQTSHTYNQEVADEITGLTVERYHGLFQKFLERMQEHQAAQ